MLNFAYYASSFLTILINIMFAHKIRFAWVLGILNQVFFIYIGVVQQQPGYVIMGLTMAVININGYIQWK